MGKGMGEKEERKREGKDEREVGGCGRKGEWKTKEKDERERMTGME